MTSYATLQIPANLKSSIWSHLLPWQQDCEPMEQAAFGSAKTASQNGQTAFELFDWVPIPESGFAFQPGYHIELADETRAGVIKRAHDLHASLVEFHSHPCSSRAEFSPSDLIGLEEFVPHVWWRLEGRPYLAIVVRPAQFDALAWITSSRSPAPFYELHAGDIVLRPSGPDITTRAL